MKIIKQYLNKSANAIKSPSMGKYLDNPGLVKYFPSFSREWKNIIYSYNKNVLRNIPMNYFNINKLIKTYFNLYFKDANFIKAKIQLFLWRRRRLLNRIYVSDADIKYTNNKAIITLFTVSTKKNQLFKKYFKLNKRIRKSFIRHFIKIYKELPWQLGYLMNKKRSLTKKYLFIKEVFTKESFVKYRFQYLTIFTKLNYFYIKKIWMAIKKKYLARRLSKTYWRKRIACTSATKSLMTTQNKNVNEYTDFYNNNKIRPLIQKIKINKRKSAGLDSSGQKTRKLLLMLRRYQLLYTLNEYKFNKSKYLPILSNYLTRITGKKIEYNIINLKSIMNSPDLFTYFVMLKIQKSKSNIGLRIMSAPLNMPYIYKEKNAILAKTPVETFEKKDPLIQTFKNPNILSNLSGAASATNLNSMLEEAYSSNENVYSTIYNNIKYKNISGMKLEISGRLTKRYKAERAKHFIRFKGGFKNRDSSYKKWSTMLFRGNTNTNISYSWQKSKRRVGSFAVKGWISGK